MRAKWDDEVLNSSTWAKEKGRLEVMLQELSTSRDEAVGAHNEAQSKIVNLLGQVRGLRSNVDDIASERDILAKEKKTLESRLKEQQERLEDLMKGESPSMRNAAAADRELLELKASLAQQEDIVAAAVGKMRRAEVLAQETQREIQAERESNVQLHKEKAALEKGMKDLQIRLVDLETKGYSSASGDVRFLNERIREVSSPPSKSESFVLNETDVKFTARTLPRGSGDHTHNRSKVHPQRRPHSQRPNLSNRAPRQAKHHALRGSLQSPGQDLQSPYDHR